MAKVSIQKHQTHQSNTPAVSDISGVRPFLALPAMGWFLWFLLVPLAIVLVYSLATKGTYGGVVPKATVSNYLRAFDWLYFKIFLNSVKLALATTLSCFFLGYPMAYVMARASIKVRSVLLILVVLPFWTNLVVRAYAIKVLLSEHGPLNSLALAFGIIEQPVALMDSALSVWIGMVTNYLPFMVLPLFVTLEKLDFALIEAAQDLGANAFQTVTRVLFPVTRPGIITGALFVFTPALGEFVIPDLLGGARTLLVGGLITDQFLKSRDWPFGSALSMLLILSVTASLILFMRTQREVSS